MIFNYDVSDLKNAVQEQVSDLETAVEGQISAYVETTTTASRSYSVGDYVIVSGLLYRVIASISNGGTFTVGTNIAETSVSTEISKVRSKTYGTTIGANATVSISRATGDHLFLVFAVRATQSANACVWLCDQWGGIITLHNSAIATLTNGTNSFELTNNMDAYLDYGVIRFSDMTN